MSNVRFLLFYIVNKCFRRNQLIFLIDKYKKIQFSPKEDIVFCQKMYLVKLLEHARTNVNFYKQKIPKDYVISERNVFEILQLLPIIDKDSIRDNYNEFKANNVDVKKVKKNSTSGSTGRSFHFLSYFNFHAQAIQYRIDDWIGKKPFDKEVKIWGAPFDIKKTKSKLSSIKLWFKRTKVLSGYNLSDQKIKEYLDFINKYKPAVLHSYPSTLFLLASFIENHNYTIVPLKIKSAGEKLFNFQRDKIEKVFNTKIFDFYGARDIPMIAQECEVHDGLHVMMENVYFEVVDENSNPISEGEGEIVVTHLHNYAMPFIRYKIGDRAKISQRECQCGRKLQIVDEIIGRSFDIIKFPNGNRVGGSFWTLVMRSDAYIKDFQVVQLSNCKVNILCTLFDNNSSPNFQRLKDNIKFYSGDKLEINFEIVDSIIPSKAGKRMFVISKK